MDLLEVQDIAVAYGKLRAVKDVSFRVRRGEVVALLGSNGSGKSTLLRTIAGVLTPSAGRVLFDGGDITGWPSHRVARRGLRLVPEGRGLLARMSVWENLLMGQYAGGGDARDLDAALARFPVLGQRRQQIASTLSGGEQQMLAIARALVARPSLLMLDEPSLGLAPAPDPRSLSGRRRPQARRGDDRARRAERSPGARRRRSRLHPRDGPGRALRPRRRARRGRSGSAGLSRRGAAQRPTS